MILLERVAPPSDMSILSRDETIGLRLCMYVPVPATASAGGSGRTELPQGVNAAGRWVLIGVIRVGGTRPEAPGQRPAPAAAAGL